MAIRIDQLDPSSDRDLEDAAALMTAYWWEVLGPGEPVFTTQEILSHQHVDRDDIAASLLLARDDERPVGFSQIDIRTGNGNEHMAWLPELYVLPADRLQGIGRRLLDEMLSLARAARRTLVLGQYNDTNDDGAAFAKAIGARIGQAERQNRVLTADIDRSLMEQWIQPVPGYSLISFDDQCPDDLLDAYVELEGVMNDAPHTDALGDVLTTSELRRKSEIEHDAEGLHQWVVVARHDATGELAGYTELILRPYKPWLIEQGDTGVVPAHRGHGLGRLLKATNALRVLDQVPEATVIETWNDGTNAPMLDINAAMGFRPVATWIVPELELP